jgi:hypothetical protein
MSTEKMIEAIRAFEAGKSVTFWNYPNIVPRQVVSGHMWRSDYEYHIKSQPKTVTIEWWESVNGKIEACRAGSYFSEKYEGANWTLLKTIEVTE